VYVSGTVDQGGNTLVWVDRKGAAQPVGAPERRYDQPEFSPDGQRLAIRILGDIWVYDLQRRTLTRLTFEGSINRPVWTPDGKRICFTAQTWVCKLSDGTGQEEHITTSPNFRTGASITSDGKIGFYTVNNPPNGSDIWTVQLDGQHKATPFLQTRFNENIPNISPDGRWLAYISDESGRYEVYVRAFPGPGGKWQISNDGGINPVWAHSGRELFFQNGGKLMVVDIAADAALVASTPRVLFEGEYEASVGGNNGRDYDISPDGQRFVMVKSSTGQSSQIDVVINWFEELKQRVHVK
jgi:Tol biopolymer transport system component